MMLLAGKWRFAALLAAGVLIAGCQSDELGYGPKHLRPLSSAVQNKIREIGSTKTAPMLVRIFKEEKQLEVWKQTRAGKFALLKSYEICTWSGKLGPKIKEGDKQAPEGFYTVTPAQMNPNSSYHLSFNLGFPNAYDRAHGRTGRHLMVHGACSSAGCYAMEDAQIQEIYALGREAFRGGQRAFQVQAFPFRMTPENMAKHHDNPNMPFWRMLKDGYDHFEVTRNTPKIGVCGKRYVFNAEPDEAAPPFNPVRQCPTYRVPDRIALAVASKQKRDEEKTVQLVAELREEQQRTIERKKREEEWKKRDTMIAEILNGGPTEEGSAVDPQDRDDAPALADAAASKTQGPAGPAPTAKPGTALALAKDDQPEKPSGGLFGSLFGTADEAKTEDREPAPEQAEATAEAASGASAEPAPAPVKKKTAAVQPAKGDRKEAAAAAAAKDAETADGSEAVPAAENDGAAADEKEDEEPSVFSRWLPIGNW